MDTRTAANINNFQAEVWEWTLIPLDDFSVVGSSTNQSIQVQQINSDSRDYQLTCKATDVNGCERTKSKMFRYGE